MKIQSHLGQLCAHRSMSSLIIDSARKHWLKYCHVPSYWQQSGYWEINDKS